MSYGPRVVFSGSIASGASTVSFDLGGKSYSRVYVEVGTMSTAAALTVFGSNDGTSFYPIFERVNTAPVQYQTLTVASSNAGSIVPLDVPCNYVQFRASAVVSGGVSMALICVD